MNATGQTPSGSPFWRFSLSFYREEGVADACITLQEQSGVDVNLLLYLLWQATSCRSFAESDVEWIERQIARWRASTVIPLRALRRALKEPPGLVDAASTEAFRTRIKGVELEAERLQQEAMYRLEVPSHHQATSPIEAARASLTAYRKFVAVPFSEPVLEIVLGRFSATVLESRSG